MGQAAQKGSIHDSSPEGHKLPLVRQGAMKRLSEVYAAVFNQQSSVESSHCSPQHNTWVQNKLHTLQAAQALHMPS